MTTAVVVGPPGTVRETRSEFPFGSWVSLVLAGEAAGFVVPGLAWYAAWKVGLPPLGLAAAVVPAGACEGAVLGLSQWFALRRSPAPLPQRWVGATAIGAGVSWTCGLAPNTAYDLGAPAWLAMTLGVLVAPLLLLALPCAQWLVLRRSATRAWRWIPWNVGAWILGLPPTFIAPALMPATAPELQLAAAYLAGGVLMATIVALTTGVAMRRITSLDAGRPQLTAPG